MAALPQALLTLPQAPSAAQQAANKPSAALISPSGGPVRRAIAAAAPLPSPGPHAGWPSLSRMPAPGQSRGPRPTGPPSLAPTRFSLRGRCWRLRLGPCRPISFSRRERLTRTTLTPTPARTHARTACTFHPGGHPLLSLALSLDHPLSLTLSRSPSLSTTLSLDHPLSLALSRPPPRSATLSTHPSR